ncbi:hypothetical protein K0M31_016211 [Melipona bicolor]|uniref:Uncharacterized protein n=1 Tax=Melipona bicolor TaxID=60889 RepID=A0AA40KT85_9HYME|nr:hypothetical protein K0M31_016211 [Melipona bicolor]
MGRKEKERREKHGHEGERGGPELGKMWKGYALFPNPSERDAREPTSRPTKMKVTEKVGALLRSVSPACDDVIHMPRL